MQLIDPSKTEVRHQKTGDRTWVRHRHHHDGSVDAKVKVAALRIGMVSGAPLNREHIAAIGALEEASKQAYIAKHSGNAEWAAYTVRRVAEAKQRVEETQ